MPLSSIGRQQSKMTSLSSLYSPRAACPAREDRRLSASESQGGMPDTLSNA
jgi:hypothetical protein